MDAYDVDRARFESTIDILKEQINEYYNVCEDIADVLRLGDVRTDIMYDIKDEALKKLYHQRLMLINGIRFNCGTIALIDKVVDDNKPCEKQEEDGV